MTPLFCGWVWQVNYKPDNPEFLVVEKVIHFDSTKDKKWALIDAWSWIIPEELIEGDKEPVRTMDLSKTKVYLRHSSESTFIIHDQAL